MSLTETACVLPVICGGVTLIVVFGPKKEENYDIGDLIRLWTQWPILTWVGGNAVLFVVLEVVRRKITNYEIETHRAADALRDKTAGTPTGGPSECEHTESVPPLDLL